MSFGTTPPRNDYVGTGAVVTYSYGFRIFAYTDLKVTVRNTRNVETTLVYPTDFSATGVNVAAGGTITILKASLLTGGFLTTGYALTIRFSETTNQPVDLRNQGGFFMEVVEDLFDRVVRFVQQVEDIVNRSLHLPETEVGTATLTTLPVAADRASKFLGFDSSGNPIAAAGTSADLTPVSAFINTLLDDADATIAKQTLLLDKHGADIASAATLNLDGSTGDLVDVTGTTTITAVTLAEGVEKTVRFTGALTLTHGASLVLPGEANITTAAGHVAVFRGYASGVVRVVSYQKLDGTAVVVATADVSQLIKNVGFTATVAANALTITVTAKDGTALSSSNKATLAFRNATLTTGQWSLVDVTSAITVTVSSGSTLGTVNGVASRLYLAAINNAGTVELAIWNPYDATTTVLRGVNESGVVSTTAEGGAGAADSATTLYSTTARSNVAVRVIGYLEISEATAGTWATAPTVLQIMGPGVRRTGDIAQRLRTSSVAQSTGTTAIPRDNTIPQNTEGDQYLSLAITPTSTINLLDIDVQINGGHGTNAELTVALFQDSTAGALAAALFHASAGANEGGSGRLHYEMAAGTTSATTFKVRAGGAAGATFTLNQSNGGVAVSDMRIVEVFQ